MADKNTDQNTLNSLIIQEKWMVIILSVVFCQYVYIFVNNLDNHMYLIDQTKKSNGLHCCGHIVSRSKRSMSLRVCQMATHFTFVHNSMEKDFTRTCRSRISQETIRLIWKDGWEDHCPLVLDEYALIDLFVAIH